MQFHTLLLNLDHPPLEILVSLAPFALNTHHPDIFWLTPEEGKSSISIEQAHNLVSSLRLKPNQAAFKLAIISPAHALTVPAQNALLKTLEEPPDNTKILLATSMPQRLLPTILSRCVKIASEQKSILKNPFQFYPALTGQSVSEALKLSDSWGAHKEDVKDKLYTLLDEVKAIYRRDENAKAITDQKAIIACITQVEGNVNLKLALDHLFLKLRSN